MEEKQQWL
jgi:hypothetical protein